jgi:hypothetical protein
LLVAKQSVQILQRAYNGIARATKAVDKLTPSFGARTP